MTDTLSLFPPKEKTGRKPARKSKPTRKNQRNHPISETKAELVGAIQTTQNLIKQAYVGFNQVVDPDLVESYVFEINALQCRHNYLTRQLRDWERGKP